MDSADQPAFRPPSALRVARIGNGPLIEPSTHPSIGSNIQGPSLVAVPDWIPDRLGRYYLYFADHKGSYIRMAYSDDLTGPYVVHDAGTLQLHESHFPTEPAPCTDEQLERITAHYTQALGALGVTTAQSIHSDITTPHIASPDVHVDHDTQRLVMYFHGLESLANQQSRVAVSADGLSFVVDPTPMQGTYLRAFSVGSQRYCLTMPGNIWKLGPGLTDVEPGPQLFDANMRHCAVVVRGETLHVLYTIVGDAPECIVHSHIDVSGPMNEWTNTEPTEVMRPELSWEGADQPCEPSRRSVAPGRVNQLRDPALFHEAGRDYLLYAIAGESGIALAEIHGLNA